jgi:hypothetical protein
MAQRVAVRVLDEGLFVEGEPRWPRHALNANHHPAHDHGTEKRRDPAFGAGHGPPGLAQLRDLRAPGLGQSVGSGQLHWGIVQSERVPTATL